MWHSIVLMLQLTTFFFFFTCLWSVPPSLLRCVCLSFPQSHLVHLASPVNCVYLLISKQYVVIQNVGDTLLWDAVIKSLLIRITYARLWQNDIKDIAYHGNRKMLFISGTLLWLHTFIINFTLFWTLSHTHGLTILVFLLIGNNNLHSQHNHMTIRNYFTFQFRTRSHSYVFVQPADTEILV